MNTFLEDTIEIDKNINITPGNIKNEGLKAAILPYYIEPNSMEIVVLLKRQVTPGTVPYDKKMSILHLETDLPMETPLTPTEAFEKLGIDADIVDTIPFGNVMPNPFNSDKAYEMLLVHISPPVYMNDTKGIIKKVSNENEKYEVGGISFTKLVEAVNAGLINDAVTRLLLNEFYIFMVEQSKNEENQNITTGEGNNYIGTNAPNNISNNINTNDLPKTTDIPDEILEMNQQMDFGKIYSKDK